MQFIKSFRSGQGVTKSSDLIKSTFVLFYDLEFTPCVRFNMAFIEPITQNIILLLFGVLVF